MLYIEDVKYRNLKYYVMKVGILFKTILQVTNLGNGRRGRQSLKNRANSVIEKKCSQRLRY